MHIPTHIKSDTFSDTTVQHASGKGFCLTYMHTFLHIHPYLRECRMINLFLTK